MASTLDFDYDLPKKKKYYIDRSFFPSDRFKSEQIFDDESSDIFYFSNIDRSQLDVDWLEKLRPYSPTETSKFVELKNEDEFTLISKNAKETIHLFRMEPNGVLTWIKTVNKTCTVYLWRFLKGSSNVGHLSLQLSDGQTYISFWPSKLPKNIKGTPSTSQPLMDDIMAEGKFPDAVLSIPSRFVPRENEIRGWWEKMKLEEKYKLFSKNCGMAVSQALHKGGFLEAPAKHLLPRKHFKGITGRLKQLEGHGFQDIFKTIQPARDSKQVPISENDFLDHLGSSRPVIISDTAGMGKTLLLQEMARRLDSRNGQVLYFRLRDFIGNVTDSNIEIRQEAIKKLFEKISIGSTVDLLLDGLDEANKKILKAATKILTTIVNLNTIRVWITTRPQFLHQLENQFGTMGYNLVPFSSETDQPNFLALYWNKNQDLDAEKVREFTDHILKLVRQKLKFKFLGVPLQCSLIGKTYRTAAREFGGGKVTESCFQIGEMYEKLIDKKIETFEKKYKDNTLKLTNYELKLVHVGLALKLLFPEEFRTQYETYFAKWKLEQVWNVGILSKCSLVDSDEPTFIHRTFAEYLVAWFMSECIQGRPDEEMVKPLERFWSKIKSGFASMVKDPANKPNWQLNWCEFFVTNVLAVHGTDPDDFDKLDSEYSDEEKGSGSTDNGNKTNSAGKDDGSNHFVEDHGNDFQFDKGVPYAFRNDMVTFFLNDICKFDSVDNSVAGYLTRHFQSENHVLKITSGCLFSDLPNLLGGLVVHITTFAEHMKSKVGDNFLNYAIKSCSLETVKIIGTYGSVKTMTFGLIESAVKRGNEKIFDLILSIENAVDLIKNLGPSESDMLRLEDDDYYYQDGDLETIVRKLVELNPVLVLGGMILKYTPMTDSSVNAAVKLAMMETLLKLNTEHSRSLAYRSDGFGNTILHSHTWSAETLTEYETLLNLIPKEDLKFLVQKENELEETPIFTLIRFGTIPDHILSKFEEAGADFALRNYDGVSILGEYIRYNIHGQFCKYTFSKLTNLVKKSDPNWRSEHLLHTAAKFANVQAAEELVCVYDFNISSKDKEGCTPYEYSTSCICYSKYLEYGTTERFIQWLLEDTANKHIKTYGKPIRFFKSAMEETNGNIAKLLLPEQFDQNKFNEMKGCVESYMEEAISRLLQLTRTEIDGWLGIPRIKNPDC